MTTYVVGAAKNSTDAVVIKGEEVLTQYLCAKFNTFEQAKIALLNLIGTHGFEMMHAHAPQKIVAEQYMLGIAAMEMKPENLDNDMVFAAEAGNVYAYFLTKGEMPEDDGVATFTMVADHTQCHDGICFHLTEGELN